MATIIRLLFYGNVDKVWTFWRNSIKQSTLIPRHKFLVHNLHIWGHYTSCGPPLPAFLPNCRCRFMWLLKILTYSFTQVPNIVPSIKWCDFGTSKFRIDLRASGIVGVKIKCWFVPSLWKYKMECSLEWLLKNIIQSGTFIRKN